MEIKPNNIYLGNAYELIKEMPDKSVDLIMTDPPYQIGGLEAKSKHMTGMFKNRGKTHVHEMAQTNLGDGIDLSILNEFVRVLKKINIYIWCNKEQIYDYLTYFVKERKCNFEIIVWAKPNPAPFVNGHYLKDKEYCLFFWEQGAPVNIPFERARTYFISKTNRQDKNDYEHPCCKPVDLIEMLIKNSTGGGSIMLDPFAGSGSHLIAAKHVGVNYIGFEISEKWYQIAKDRLNGINVHGEMNLFDI